MLFRSYNLLLCDILNSDYHYYVEDPIAKDWNNGHWDDSGDFGMRDFTKEESERYEKH